MKSWKQSLRGVSMGVGILIRRRLHLEDIGFALKIATKGILPVQHTTLHSRKVSNCTADYKVAVTAPSVITSERPLGKGRGRLLFQTLTRILSRANSTTHKQREHRRDISPHDASSKRLDSYFSALPSSRMTARQKLWTAAKVLIYSTLILQAFPTAVGQKVVCFLKFDFSAH